MKNIRVELSLSDIKKLKNKIEDLKRNLDKASEEIVKELADLTEKEIDINISATPYKDGNNDTVAYKEVTKKRAIVGMRGTQALYNEYGTGTVGANNPHPKKPSSLKAYNSGATIRPNNKETSTATAFGIPLGGLYWTYEDNGIIVYTQGIPAGKQVFNASKTLSKRKGQIIKKKVSDALSKL